MVELAGLGRSWQSQPGCVKYIVAQVSAGFEEFKSAVEKFFNETNEPTEAEWNQAVQQVRQGVIAADWLPKVNAERERSVTVELLKEPAPSLNALDKAPAMAA